MRLGLMLGYWMSGPEDAVAGDDIARALLPVKWMLGFYIGRMGARQKNFHADLLRRMGFGEAVERVQALFAQGKREEAAAVPDELADELALVGPADRIRDRLQAWKESPVKTILAGRRDPVALRALARAAL